MPAANPTLGQARQKYEICCFYYYCYLISYLYILYIERYYNIWMYIHFFYISFVRMSCECLRASDTFGSGHVSVFHRQWIAPIGPKRTECTAWTHKKTEWLINTNSYNLWNEKQTKRKKLRAYCIDIHNCKLYFFIPFDATKDPAPLILFILYLIIACHVKRRQTIGKWKKKSFIFRKQLFMITKQNLKESRNVFRP